MRWLYVILALLAAVVLSRLSFAKPTRTVTLNDNNVAVIRTAVGYSTILRFDSRPTSVVLGDQDSFKAEYVGNSVTIKPLLSSSHTNMFVFTDYDQFNFKLVTSSAANVDYVVRVKRMSDEPQASKGGEALIVRKEPRHRSSRGIELSLISIGHPRNRSALILSFAISLKAKRHPELNISPSDIEVFQHGRVIPIDALYLERKTLNEDTADTGVTLIIRSSDFQQNAPLLLAYSPALGSKRVRLRLPVSASNIIKRKVSDGKVSKN